jgi:DNA polymerase-3 subunit gamma/tau
MRMSTEPPPAGVQPPAVSDRGALYRTYRSRTFDEVVGQAHVTQTLRNAVRYGKVAHAYLFTGPRGTGKTSTARILARAVNCLQPRDGEPCNSCSICVSMLDRRSLDLVEIDGASNNSVDDVRELRERVNLRPAEGRRKVFIIDEVHMLSIGAFNALLKTLEEPPDHILFALATTELQKVPATVRSRCQLLELRPIPIRMRK